MEQPSSPFQFYHKENRPHVAVLFNYFTASLSQPIFAVQKKIIQTIMGKGDKRSKRGKIWKHSHGVCRLKKSYQMTAVEKIEAAKSK